MEALYSHQQTQYPRGLAKTPPSSGYPLYSMRANKLQNVDTIHFGQITPKTKKTKVLRLKIKHLKRQFYHC